MSYTEDHPILLKDIITLIKEGKIKLIITQQLINEFYRNRETKLSSSLNTIKDLKKIDFKIPAFCSNIKSIKEIRNKLDDVEKLSQEAYDELTEDSKNNVLEVDKLVEEIFNNTKIITISDSIIERARNRFDLGNPPGKNKSYGDAINWEILLESIPNENNYTSTKE